MKFNLRIPGASNVKIDHDRGGVSFDIPTGGTLPCVSVSNYDSNVDKISDFDDETLRRMQVAAENAVIMEAVRSLIEIERA